MENKLTIKSNVGDQVIARVEALSKVGFTMPSDYQYVNAIKASLLKLQETKNKDGKSALEVCTSSSVQSALFEMATKGLDASKNQCYLIVRGDKLCLSESYFGKVLQVRRIFKDFDPKPRVVYQDDIFEYATDVTTGRKSLVKHEQKLENLDKDFIGAYMYIPTSDGGQDLYIMTKKMILAAWSQSSSREQAVHKKFTDKMVAKTIINSACNMIINSTPALAYAADDETEPSNGFESAGNDTSDAEAEFQEAEVVDTATGEVQKAPAKPQPAPQPQPANEAEEDF